MWFCEKYFKIMYFTAIFLINLLIVAAEQIPDNSFCEIGDKTCSNNLENVDEKLIFYDINPPEGFNLRRDVYMRFAIMLAEAQKDRRQLDWRLVLPPWYHLYHWKSSHSKSPPLPWGKFFDVESLRTYAPVLELYELFPKTRLRTSKNLEIDVIYSLENYPDAFEGGTFVDKWEEVGNCEYGGQYWGFNNISAKDIVCIRFQGKISMLWEVMSLHPNATKVMFVHGEIPLHDSYGTKSYWDCRKSMKFNSKLVKIAKEYIKENLNCSVDKCDSYLSVHWRRRDFAHSRNKDIPSTEGTAKQIHKTIKNKYLNIANIFIATDATESESNKLEKLIKSYGYRVFFYSPSKEEFNEIQDGGTAIIDQIICSHAAYFIGTHESTFSFRIQEEREILGFDPSTSFNRLCPDEGKCAKVSKWTIVH